MLSEIWNYKLEFYHNVFPNDNFYFVVSKTSNVCGVNIYVSNSFVVHELDYLRIPSTSENFIENLWLEIVNGNKKYIIGGIYRHPKQNIDKFNKLLDNCLSMIYKTKTSCIIAGNINIDLIRYNSHNPTSDFVNNLLFNIFLPIIIMPTQITDLSATLIDHIYYYDGSNFKRNVTIKSGNLWCDLTDHLPNYILIFNKHIKPKQNVRFVRIFSDSNIDKFKKVNKCNKLASIISFR